MPTNPDYWQTLLPQLIGAGLLLALLPELGKWLSRRSTREESPEDRIAHLTQALREAMKMIGEIESEISARHEMAQKLQVDIATYERVIQAKLTHPEIEAIAQMLRGELTKGERRTFWQGFRLNALFFALGCAVTIFLSPNFAPREEKTPAKVHGQVGQSPISNAPRSP